MEKITIGHLPIVDHLILGVAQATSELPVETKSFEGWDQVANAFQSGALDAAFLLFPLALKLFREGVESELVLLGHREGQVLTVLPEIKTIQDLAGKTIALPHRFSTHAILLHETLVMNHIDPDAIITKTETTDVRQIMDQLKSRRVDGFFLAEPMATVARKEGFGSSLTLSQDIQSHHVDCVLVVRKSLSVDHPETVQALVNVLVRAGMFINDYPRQAADIGEKFLGWPKKILLEALTHDKGHIMFWDLLPRLEDLETLQKQAVEDIHLWDSEIDLSKFINAAYAKHAYRDWVIEERKKIKDKGVSRTVPGDVMEVVSIIDRFFGGGIPFRITLQGADTAKLSLSGAEFILNSNEEHKFLHLPYHGAPVESIVFTIPLVNIKQLVSAYTDHDPRVKPEVFQVHDEEDLLAGDYPFVFMASGKEAVVVLGYSKAQMLAFSVNTQGA